MQLTTLLESAAGSSNDETMEDVDNGDQDVTADIDEQPDNDEDNDDNMDEEDPDDTQNTFDDSPSRPRPRPSALDTRQPPPVGAVNGTSSNTARSPTTVNGDPVPPPVHHGDPPTTPKTFLEDQRLPMGAPSVRQEALTAPVYDIAPTIAAPHSTSINAITATPDMRWVFSGGADGWIRKFNWVDTVNAKSMLTVAQRHPYVDSVIKAGVLMSYWENEEPSEERSSTPQPPDEALPLSSVYSLAVHRQALWLLSGTEIGAINLQSVRHDEGKRITSLYKHTSAVSVMSLSQDQTSLLSGSWDKSILDWDLNTGQVKRSFTGSKAQISALEVRPISNLPVPSDDFDYTQTSDTFTGNSAERFNRGSQPNGVKKEDTIPAPPSPHDSLFGGGSGHDSLFGDNDGVDDEDLGLGDGQDDEIGKAIASGIRQQEQLETTGGMSSSMDQQDGTDFQLSASDTNSGNEPNGLSVPSTFDTSNDSHGLPDIDDFLREADQFTQSAPAEEPENISESVFLDAAIDGMLRIWDRRQQIPISRIAPSRSTPPWCMNASWSPDGNYIYAGRRNNTVDEYSLHKGLREPTRSLKFPAGSGPVSSVRAMPNNKHLIW